MSFHLPPTTPDRLWLELVGRGGDTNPFWSTAASIFQRRGFQELESALSRWDAVIAQGADAFGYLSPREARPQAAATLAGFTALARSAVAAERGDAAATTTQFAAAHRHIAMATDRPSHATQLKESASLADLLDQVDDDVLRSALAKLYGDRSSQHFAPPEHALSLPVLFSLGHRGAVGLLHFERSSGIGTLCSFAPHLAMLGFRHFDARFREASRIAWELVRPEFAPGTRVRWWLSVAEDHEICGDSAGAAFAAGLHGLAHGLRFARVGITGSIMADGRVGRVGGHLAKAAALEPAGVTRFVTARGDRAATDLVRDFYPGLQVHEILTYRDSIPILCGEVDAAVSYLTECRKVWAANPWSATQTADAFLGPDFISPSIIAPGEPKACKWSTARETMASAAILGGPGSGKSTLLRYEGWLAAGEQLAGLASGTIAIADLLLPVLISAVQLAERIEEHLDAIAIELASVPQGLANFFRQAVQGRRVVWLIEGWDEVPDSQLNGLMLWLRRADLRRVYVTARHAGAAGAVEAAGGVRVEVAEWTDDEWDRYARAQFDDAGYRAFVDAVQRSPGALELARTPLLLTLLCRAASRRPELPATRSELFAVCLDGLLGVWPVARGGMARELTDSESLAMQERRDAAARFAWALAASKPNRTAFGLRQLQEAIESARSPMVSLSELTRQNGLLVRVKDAPPTYRFLHRTLFEYLLAWAIARQDDWTGEVSRRLYDPDWGDVLALVGGALVRQDAEDNPGEPSRADDLLGLLIDMTGNDALFRPLILAARAAAEVPASPHRQPIAQALVQIYLAPSCPVPRSQLVGPIAGLAGEATRILIDAVRESPDVRRDPWEEFAKQTAECSPSPAEIWDRVNLRLVFAHLGTSGRSASEQLVEDSDPEVASFAFRLFAAGPVPAAVVARARQCLAPALPLHVRRDAADLLALAPMLDAIPELLAVAEETNAVGRRAVAALASVFAAAPESLPNVLGKSSHGRNGLLAAFALASRTMPNRLDWLTASAQSPIVEFRLTGLQGLHDRSAMAPELLPIVAKLAASDPEPAVRAAAIVALPLFGLHALPILRELAVSEPRAACGLAMLDVEYALDQEPRLLAAAPADALVDLARRSVFSVERVCLALLDRAATAPAASLCELVSRVADLAPARLEQLGDRLADRLLAPNASDQPDLLDAAHRCLALSPARSRRLLESMRERAEGDTWDYDNSLSPIPSSIEHPDRIPTRDSFTGVELPRLLTLFVDSTGVANLEVVASLWRAAAREPVAIEAVPIIVRELVGSIRNRVGSILKSDDNVTIPKVG